MPKRQATALALSLMCLAPAIASADCPLGAEADRLGGCWEPVSFDTEIDDLWAAISFDAETALIISGYGDTQSHILDTQTLAMTTVASFPGRITRAPVATRLSDGRILLVGNDISAVYDRGSNSWQSPQPVEGARQLLVFPDGATELVSRREYHNWFVQEFNEADGSWNQLGEPLDSTQSFDFETVVPLSDGDILLLGGYEMDSYSVAWRFDQDSNSWSEAAHLPEVRVDNEWLRTASGDVLVFGGNYRSFECFGDEECDGEIVDDGAHDSVWRYLTESGVWEDAAPLAVSDKELSTAALSDGRVLVWGDHVQVFDPTLNAWQLLRQDVALGTFPVPSGSGLLILRDVPGESFSVTRWTPGGETT
ncbi:MAG: hypothetical protein KC561_11370, partial [Myxococcales bacterium]|nr:hypothetical protein [Myxococcales bacterium]